MGKGQDFLIPSGIVGIEFPQDEEADRARPVSEDLSTIAGGIGRAQGWIVATLFLAIPLLNLLNPSQFRIQAATHGFFAFLVVASGAYLGHLAYLLLRGNRSQIEKTKTVTYVTLIAALGATVSGNWIYMPYRGEHGAKERLLATAPTVHKVLMEFKEFASLFPLPMLAVCAFLLSYYGPRLKTSKDLSFTVGILLMVSWLFMIVGMALGLTIAKIQFV